MLDHVLTSAWKQPHWLAHTVISSGHHQYRDQQSVFLALGLPSLFAETSDVCLISEQQELPQSLFKFHLGLLYIKVFGLLTLFGSPAQLCHVIWGWVSTSPSFVATHYILQCLTYVSLEMLVNLGIGFSHSPVHSLIQTFAVSYILFHVSYCIYQNK